MKLMTANVSVRDSLYLFTLLALTGCDNGTPVAADTYAIVDANLSVQADAADVDAGAAEAGAAEARDAAALDAGRSRPYRVVLLDTVGTEGLRATCIHPDGSRVGGYVTLRIDDVLTSLASIWTADGRRSDARPIAGLGAGVQAFDADGNAVGWTSVTEGVEYPSVGARLTPTGLVALPGLPSPHPFGSATGIANGFIVGTGVDADETVSMPWVWNAGVTRSLGSFGGTNGRAEGINRAGQIVGWSQLTPSGPDDFVSHGFVVPAAGTLATATHIEGLGGSTTFARGINSDGVVIGDSRDAGGTTRAFVWSASDGIEVIHSPPAGVSFTLVRAINASSIVVGTEPTSAGPLLAWYWAEGSGDQLLDTMVALDAGWHVRDALAIADDGSIVAELTDASETSHFAVLRR